MRLFVKDLGEFINFDNHKQIQHKVPFQLQRLYEFHES